MNVNGLSYGFPEAREWQPQDKPELVDVHDFPSDSVDKAVPYGAYDVAASSAFVSVGTDLIPRHRRRK